jgi:hypothetical protein
VKTTVKQVAVKAPPKAKKLMRSWRKVQFIRLKVSKSE